MKSGAKTQTRCDKQGHPLAHWDNHSACRTCLRAVGIKCSRLTPCNVCQCWTIEMWEAFEDAEYRSAQKRDRRRCLCSGGKGSCCGRSRSSPSARDALGGEAYASTQGPSRRALKSSSAHRRNTSMGADAEWSPWESNSGSDPTVPQLIADPLTLYRNAVLRYDRGANSGLAGISRLAGPDRLAKLAGPCRPGLRMIRPLVNQTWTGEIFDREE